MWIFTVKWMVHHLLLRLFWLVLPGRADGASSDLGKFIGRAIGVAQEFVGPRVIGKTLRLRVPLEVGLRLVRDVRDQCGGSTPVASLDIAIALLPAAHAVEEIARVQRRAVLAFRFSRLDRGVTTRLIFAAERPVERRERGEHFVAEIFRDDFVTVPRQVERALRAADLDRRGPQAGRSRVGGGL